MSEIKKGLKLVLSKIEQACSRRNKEVGNFTPRLVAVSKTNPVEAIIEAYDAGQRYFGENYIQELEEKATNQLLIEKCPEIKWHLIGHLQSNKVNKVLTIPNLYLIESVDSEKLARKLNKNWPLYGEADRKLKILIQVNTSGEAEKSGVSPDAVTSLYQLLRNECSNLQLDGLMTIGQYGYDPKDGPNPDFLKLLKCKQDVCETLGLQPNDVEISMGMSNDYEQAVELGSSNVRVGSAIFGARQQKT